jgi:hypothetical protein
MTVWTTWSPCVFARAVDLGSFSKAAAEGQLKVSAPAIKQSGPGRR